MDIYLHDKYGLNPTMTTCYFCGKPSEIILVGRKTGEFVKKRIADPDGRMPMNIGVINKRPCQECEKMMEQGIMFISIRDGEPQSENPYRTGRMSLIKDTSQIFDLINQRN